MSTENFQLHEPFVRNFIYCRHNESLSLKQKVNNKISMLGEQSHHSLQKKVPWKLY